jgi:ATP-binding cassette subfamily F protein uup
VLLVSHDRDFLDRVATATLLFEGQGKITAFAGGWSDAMAQRGEAAPAAKPVAKPAKDEAPAAKPKAAKSGLSFTEKHRLEELPEVIARLEAEMAKLSTLLADPDLYSREPAKFAKATEALAERQAKLDAAEEEWLTLAEKAEGAGA